MSWRLYNDRSRRGVAAGMTVRMNKSEERLGVWFLIDFWREKRTDVVEINEMIEQNSKEHDRDLPVSD